MTNFKFTLQYDGTRYDGWQRQGNTDNTIQGKIERVLSEMMEHAVEIHGAGRTDAGVHANAQVAHCKLNTTRTPAEMRDYMNRYLPADIAVTFCEEVSERFHARLHAKGKRYVYRLQASGVPNVFERKYICAWEKPLDIERMREAAVLLTGTHDFRAFSSLKRVKKSTMRTLSRFDIQEIGSEIRFVMEGDGFLYHMARILVGTLVAVGQGDQDPAGMPAVLKSLDRQRAGLTMPPQGLILDKVFF